MRSEIDRVSIKKSDRDLYRNLKEESILKGRTNKELFMLAMAFGIEKSGRIEFKTGEKEGFFLLKELKEYEESLFYAVAIAEEDNLGIINDKKKVYSICEEYANGGINILKAEIFSGDFADFSKRLENILRSKINSFKKIDK